MRARKRLITAMMAIALIAVLPGTALADDDTRGDAAPVEVESDRPADKVTDQPSDRPSDKPTDRPTDRCVQVAVDRRCVDDIPNDRCLTAAEIDRRCIDVQPTDRCVVDAVNDRRCVDDHRPHDINIRKLIWRLIHAHEWEKLVRLLHWLGWL